MIPLDEQREVQTVLRAELGARRVKNNKWTYETDGAGIGGEAGDAPCAETADGNDGGKCLNYSREGQTGARRREFAQVGNELSCVLGRWPPPRRPLIEPVFRGTN